MQQGAKSAATPAKNEAIKDALNNKFILLILRVKRLRFYEEIAKGKITVKIVPWLIFETTLISP